MAIAIPRGAQIALRYAAVTIVTFVVFLIALQLTFPYERVRARAEEMLSDKYDAQIHSVSRSWIPGRFTLEGVSLKTRPSKPGEIASTLYIQSLEVDVHLLAALHGTGSIDFDAKLVGEHNTGHITGNLTAGKSATTVRVDGADVPSDALPMRELLGLPMTGDLDLALSVTLPNETTKAGVRAADWAEAEGSLAFSCPANCTIGDGKTKFKPRIDNARNAAVMAEGIDFGKVELQSLVAEAKLTPGPGDDKPGKLEVTKFEIKSNDGELHVDFNMTTMPDINNSPVAGCIRYKGSQDLQKRAPQTASALMLIGGILGPDGLFHIKLGETFRKMSHRPTVCTSGGDDALAPAPSTISRGRPTLAPVPPGSGEPGRPPMPPPPQPPAVTPPPPQEPPTASGSSTPPTGSAGVASGAPPGPPAFDPNAPPVPPPPEGNPPTHPPGPDQEGAPPPQAPPGDQGSAPPSPPIIP